MLFVFDLLDFLIVAGRLQGNLLLLDLCFLFFFFFFLSNLMDGEETF